MGSVLIIALQSRILDDYKQHQREKNKIFEPHSSRKIIKKPQFKKNKYELLLDEG